MRFGFYSLLQLLLFGDFFEQNEKKAIISSICTIQLFQFILIALNLKMVHIFAFKFGQLIVQFLASIVNISSHKLIYSIIIMKISFYA